MAKQVSFIHAADLHLDSPFRGLANMPEELFQKVRESTFDALRRLVQIAIDKKVDFILIVGDLFDNERQSLKAQIYLRRAFEELNRHHIDVYLSYGNHDFIQGNPHPVTYSDNVHVFPDEKVRTFTFEKDGQDLANIYGFSYEKRAVIEKKATEFNIVNPEVPFHIATLHGSIGSNTEHDVYAPFQITDLVEKDFDYWALGHIHKREILKKNPPVVYPGNTQGRNRKETDEKGCYHVILSETATELNFISLQSIMYSRLHVDVSKCEEIHQVELAILADIEKMNTPTNLLIDLTLEGDFSNLKKWESDKLLDDLIELVNETLATRQTWLYIFRVAIEGSDETIEPELYNGEHFIGELVRNIDDTAVQPYLQDLYQHRSARKYLQSISEDEEQMIKKEAKILLLRELLKG
ncbi:metallophosphoesterase family protein [Oceanobacillus bengalensis]|uniref:DNA repair exonuclease n=1 Tax=Oceanobacillus bengalensis TaxID=1435466 RepID=A0A494Z869_9BACI|nr:DNA repair exonuclease [Oceanobacillus bengalensis]RKQ18794.1 DNA repair exonuclease [Oceanobacillus bengalensis]